MACLSLLRIRHALATCAAGLMLALPAMASSSNTTDLGLDREAALRTSRRPPAITGTATQTRPSTNSSASVA